MEEKIRYKIPKPTTETNKRTGQKGYKIYNFTWYENGKRKVSDTKRHLTKEECIYEAETKIKGSCRIWIPYKYTSKKSWSFIYMKQN